MTASRQQLGRRAEDLVAQRLQAAGWELLARNARTRYGELDIVARDGRSLVFVEVKAGRAGAHFGPERPVLAVDARKQQRLRRLATAWIAANRGRANYAAIRFDAIGVTFGSKVEVEHIEGAF
jgi:putative endonuclease